MSYMESVAADNPFDEYFQRLLEARLAQDQVRVICDVRRRDWIKGTGEGVVVFEYPHPSPEGRPGLFYDEVTATGHFESDITIYTGQVALQVHPAPNGGVILLLPFLDEDGRPQRKLFSRKP